MMGAVFLFLNSFFLIVLTQKRTFKVSYRRPLGGTCMTKKVVAIMVLVMVASLSIAGCTNSTNNPATSPTPQGHDPTLEKLIDAYKQEIDGNQSTTLSTWNVTWNNATSANILFTFETSGNGSFGLTATVSVNDTVRSFPTTQDATSF